jgi:hypothetical protein
MVSDPMMPVVPVDHYSWCGGFVSAALISHRQVTGVMTTSSTKVS